MEKVIISIYELNEIFNSIKPFLNKKVKESKVDKNFIIYGKGSLFDSLDFVTFIMGLEKYMEEKRKIKVTIHSNLPETNNKITREDFLKINHLEVIDG